MTQLQEPQPYWAYGWMFGHVFKVKAAKDGKKMRKRTSFRNVSRGFKLLRRGSVSDAK
jgi:hypothetical protein